MTTHKKLVIILISLSFALIASIFGIVLVFTDSEQSISTDFEFVYDNLVGLFQVQNTINASEFNTIDTSIGNVVDEPEIFPMRANYFFDGWYLDEECTIEAEFPIESSLETKLYPKFIEGNVPAANIYFDKDHYSLTGDMKSSTLETIVIPDAYDDGVHGEYPLSESVNRFLYQNLNVKNLYISNSISETCTYFAYRCKALENVKFGKGIETISKNSFFSCGFLNLELPQKTRIIEESAFSGCNSLVEVNIPEGVEFLGDDSFASCSLLTTIKISSSVVQMEGAPFNWCYNLVSIYVDENNEIYTSRDSNNQECNAIIDISRNTLISGCLTTNIPNTVTCIGSQAFLGCIYLSEIIIPNSVETIGSLAFNACAELSDLIFSNKLVEIGSEAFQLCIKLTQIDLPESLEKIGDSAFNGCDKITEITIPKNVTTIGVNPFQDCGELIEIIVDVNNTTFTSRNISGEECNFIVNKATNIFVSGCGGTTEIPNGVVKIGEAAFYEYDNIDGLILPDTVIEVEDEAFYGCHSLNIVISSNITSIGKNSFYYCNNVIFAENSSLTSIGEYAFYLCYNINEFVIPSSVTYIGKYAFYYCNSLVNIEFEDPTGWEMSKYEDFRTVESIDLSNASNNVDIFVNTYKTYYFRKV